MSKSTTRKRLNTSNKENKLSFTFTDIDTVFGRVDMNGSKMITMVVCGTLWSFPALKTLETASALNLLDVDVYLVDQDASPEFCEQQGIVAGSPAVVLYYERAPMNIMRPKASSAVGFFSGQLNKDNFKTLILQAQSAAAKEVKGDAARVFRLPF